MKKIISIVFIVGLVGCTSSHPVPAEAFKICYEKGGAPIYKSSVSGTRFMCLLPGTEFEGNF